MPLVAVSCDANWPTVSLHGSHARLLSMPLAAMSCIHILSGICSLFVHAFGPQLLIVLPFTSQKEPLRCRTGQLEEVESRLMAELQHVQNELASVHDEHRVLNEDIDELVKQVSASRRSHPM